MDADKVGYVTIDEIRDHLSGQTTKRGFDGRFENNGSDHSDNVNPPPNPFDRSGVRRPKNVRSGNRNHPARYSLQNDYRNMRSQDPKASLARAREKHKQRRHNSLTLNRQNRQALRGEVGFNEFERDRLGRGRARRGGTGRPGRRANSLVNLPDDSRNGGPYNKRKQNNRRPKSEVPATYNDAAYENEHSQIKNEIEKVMRFLDHPSLQNMTETTKRKFLLGRGISSEIVDAAVDRFNSTKPRGTANQNT
eukprot:UN25515